MWHRQNTCALATTPSRELPGPSNDRPMPPASAGKAMHGSGGRWGGVSWQQLLLNSNPLSGLDAPSQANADLHIVLRDVWGCTKTAPMQLGYFTAVCHTWGLKEVVKQDDADNPFFVEPVACLDNTTNPWKMSRQISGVLVKLKIDTGADASVIPTSVYSHLCNSPCLQQTSATFIHSGRQI